MSGFVTDTVEEELAYGMEALGIAPQTMRRRVEDTLDLLGLVEIRDRPLLSLSGGQRQRPAIGSVLTTNPRCWYSMSRRVPSILAPQRKSRSDPAARL